jgi:hypothetical protein
MSHSREFCRHNTLCCLSTSVYCCKRIFRYRLSPETSGYTLVHCIQWESEALSSVSNLVAHFHPELWSRLLQSLPLHPYAFIAWCIGIGVYSTQEVLHRDCSVVPGVDSPVSKNVTLPSVCVACNTSYFLVYLTTLSLLHSLRVGLYSVDWRMIVNDEYRRILKEVTVAYFNVLYQNVHGDAE